MNKYRGNSRRHFAEYYSPRAVFAFDDANPATMLFDGASCCGEHGHGTFYRAVVCSPEWQAWREEQDRRVRDDKRSVYDMPEVEECGIISRKHFADFLRFVRDLPEMKIEEEDQ